jgi:hypothetical protein
MPFIPVDEGLEIVVQGHRDSIIIQNVFGWKTTDDLDQALTDNIGDLLADAYGELLGATSDSFHWDTVTVTDVRTVDGPQFVATTFDDLVGTSSANPLPYQTAGLISWSTNTRGRSYRGRTYLGLFTEAFSDGRNVAAGLVTAMGAFATVIREGGAFAVLSRYTLNPTPPPNTIPRDPGIATLITGSTVHPLWRTQRRRATR